MIIIMFCLIFREERQGPEGKSTFTIPVNFIHREKRKMRLIRLTFMLVLQHCVTLALLCPNKPQNV